ncbi:cytochrome P450 [Streptomyces yaizuensis]|uniref:Cytochrome P450 n=1 Tax=Streptomyces yaizuensis TaxID=2989713 RepID=A0ABQ5P296_9ACTN|nr:hypothetical protein [Streptomyces sp. YSPA8]GLF96716.1 cytochrome P450 [Streptomyces sp. YSPA8]
MTTGSAARAAAAAALLKCPAPLYERMHRKGPLVWSEPDRTWMVTGYGLARLVLRDTRFRMPGPQKESEWAEDGSHGGFFQSMLLACEGDTHTRLRRFLGRLFTPRAVRARTVRIEAAMAALLDEARDGGRDGVRDEGRDEGRDEARPDTAPGMVAAYRTTLDVTAEHRTAPAGVAEHRTTLDGVAAISARLPVSVIGDLVGIPDQDRERVSDVCRAISRGGGVASGPPSGDAVGTALARVDELGALVDRWLAAPDHLVPDSVLALAADAEDTPDALSRTEVVANVFSLYIAGHDTSRNMLSGLLLKLAADPALLDGLTAGTVDTLAEVDRLLLAESPLTFTVRVAREECELAGHTIRPGDMLRVMLGAANHQLLTGGSPADRSEAGSGVSFGEGRHVCLGARLARTEGQVMLDAVGRYWSAVRPAAEPVWTPHFLHRGLESLPLEITWR